MKVQKFVLLSLVLAALFLSCPVSASWSNTLNNGDIALYTQTTCGCSGTYCICGSTGMSPLPGYLDTEAANVTTHQYRYGYPTGYWITQNASGSSNYFGYTYRYTGSSSGVPVFGFFDATRSQIYGYSNSAGITIPADSKLHRIEIERSGVYVNTYLDGTLNNSYTSVTGTPIYAFGVGEQSTLNALTYYDDLSFGNSFSTTSLVSVMPHSDYILSDMINPSNFGLYSSSGTLLYSDQLHIQWSVGPYADGWQVASNPPNSRYSIRITAPDGSVINTTYLNFTAAGSAAGIYTYPMNATYLAGAPLQYGVYWVTLYDGSSVKSTDYFYVIATGATVMWGQSAYTIGSTATVTYSVSSSYWDTSTYSYSLKTVNIYGTAVDTYDLTSSSGSQSIELTDAKYPAGVYYAEIIATKFSDSSTYIMNYAAMETSAYVYLSGHIMNEETGTVISGATVNVTQGGTTVSYTSDSSGAWGNSSQYWLTGPSIYLAASESGFYGYSGSFTPLAGGNIARNISMQPTSETYYGVAINGVNSDTQYGNPIPNATIYLRVNGTSDTPQQTFTNIAGYYIFNNLTNGVTYDIWPEKTGFLNSVWLRQVTARGG